MNKFTMAIWGFTIFTLVSIVLIIGLKQQDKDYAKLTTDLRMVAKKYIGDKKIKLKINESSVIFISDLIEENYLKEDEKIDKYCIKSIVVQREVFRNIFKFNTECENEIEEDI